MTLDSREIRQVDARSPPFELGPCGNSSPAPLRGQLPLITPAGKFQGQIPMAAVLSAGLLLHHVALIILLSQLYLYLIIIRPILKHELHEVRGLTCLAHY